MAIIFGSDSGVREDHFTNFVKQITQDVSDIGSGLADNFSRLTGDPSSARRPPLKENVFVDDGFSNVPGTSFVGSGIGNIDDIKTRRHTTQEPILTLYVKKRQFWSLRSEYDTRFMDSSDKLFMRAAKLLFERKTGQLAAYEALTKAASLISEEVDLDSNRIRQLIEILDSGIEVLQENVIGDITTAVSQNTISPELNEIFRTLQEELGKLNDAVENLKDIVKLNDKLRHATHTTWVVDPDDVDVIETGRGSGVIEFTNVSNIQTSLSIEGGIGSINFTLEDPYNIMKIREDDIDAAVNSAFFTSANKDNFTEDQVLLFNRGPAQILEDARRKEEQLRDIRKDRIGDIFGARSPLNTSELPEIVFEINPTSSAANKVTASVTTLSETFNENNFRIALLQLPGIQQLTNEEDTLVKEIFSLLNEYVNTVELLNDRDRSVNLNEDVKYARRQLRKYYLGRSLVQPMDGVHVYIRSKTLKESEGVGPLDALLTGSHFVQQFAQDRDVTDDLLEEEMRQFGLEKLGISADIYKLLRTSSFLRNAGTHVFGGLISNATENYNASNGTYTLNVSGNSNMKWLDMSRINIRPSKDQVEGVLEDPLTPFRFEIEEGTGLIKGKELLQTNLERINDGLLNYDDASARQGQKVTQNNLAQDYVDNGDGTAQEVQSHAPGMVYRWKEGIIAVTRDVNLKRPLDGSDNQSDKLARDYGLTIVSGSQESGPFANLDAADIISLLVTGWPHNYESFFENARSVGTFVPGKDNSAESFFHSFFDIQRSVRKALGNFQPFKVINIDQKSLHTRVKIQSSIRQDSRTIRNLRSELVRFQDRLQNISGQKFKSGLEPVRQRTEKAIKDTIRSIENEIDKVLGNFKAHATQGENLGLRLYGNDPTSTLVDTETAVSESESREESDRSVRLRNTILQMRPQLQCKFNSDTNLFIVGDEYDKDLDIQAFVLQSLNSQESPIWESGYKKPMEICHNVAKTLDFEFFCDTSGHIQFRPPRYNKIPLSLLLKLFLLDEKNGKQLYPDFLKSLFNVRVESFRNQLRNIDTEIAINITKLGGNIEDNLIKQSEERVLDEESLPDVFSLQPINASNIIDTGFSDAAEKVISLTNNLRAKIGGQSIREDSKEEREITQNIEELNNPNTSNINSKRLALANKTSQLISRRQQVAATLSKIEEQRNKSVKAGESSRISPNITREQREEILAPFKDLIEDDFNDFLGPGSSKRFIIYDEQIISSNFIESDENVDFTRIDVTGAIDLLGDREGDIGKIPVLWAGATDFDLWRQYGWRSQGAVNKPFFKDAETQCAPYALMLLTRMRRDAIRGSVTLYGNEYYQLGDVVYVNSRDMLYYVTRVDHSFDYNSGSFQTTLELRYGHPLGEYLPTPLDVIGKALIKNQRTFNRTKTSRQTVPAARPVTHLGRFIFPDEERESPMIDMLSEPFGAENVIQLKNALLKASVHIGANDINAFPKVEIRGYNVESSDAEKVRKRMEAVRTWFTSPRGKFVKSKEDFIKLSKEEFDDNALSQKQIKIVDKINDPVNIVTPNEFNKQNSRFPREEVFNAASTVGIDNVIEAVLVFE